MRKTLACALVLLAAVAGADTNGRKVSTTSYPNCFKMVDSTDHVTAKTGLTVACTRSKNGGSFASCSGSVSEVANGVYCIAGNATDRDTVGSLVFHMTGTAADARDFEIPITTNDPFIAPDTASTIAAVTTVTTTTTATTCTNLTNAATAGDFTSTMKTSLNNSTPACSSVSGAVGSVTGNVGGNIVGSVASVTGNVGGNVTGSVGSVTGNVGGNVVGSVASVTAPVTAGTVSDKTGYALSGAGVTAVQAGLATTVNVSAVETDTQDIQSRLPSALVSGRMDSSVGAMAANTVTAAAMATDASAEIWTSATRTLTSGGGATAADVWQYATRSLTDFDGDITIVAPVLTTGTITLVRNDDHFLADGRSLTFTKSTWVDLTGATEIRLTVRKRPSTGVGADPVYFTMTDKTASRVVGVGSQTVIFEPTKTDTASLVPGTGTVKYDIQATLASGHIVTLQTGVGNVTEDQTRP